MSVSASARFARWWTHKTVPVHSATRWYYFGGITLFLFGIQIITGTLLLFYYRPTVAEGFDSVRFIMTRVEFGWLIRSIHSWSANLMIFMAFVHMFSVVFTHAYRPPRELDMGEWHRPLGLMLGFGFSGYLLPWNQISYFATKVGSDVARGIPLVGEQHRARAAWRRRCGRGNAHAIFRTACNVLPLMHRRADRDARFSGPEERDEHAALDLGVRGCGK